MVAEARRQSRLAACELGLGSDVAARAGLVATELATNLLKHAGSGDLSISPYDDFDGRGIEILALDKGPGIANIADALSRWPLDGGLARLWPRRDPPQLRSLLSKFGGRQGHGDPGANRGAAVPPGFGFESGAINCPYPDEVVCGDGSAIRVLGPRVVVMMVDGSGHGVARIGACAPRNLLWHKQRDPPNS